MEWTMRRAFMALVGLLAVLAVAEPAAARDGCGQGAYWDGYGCAPMRMQRDYAPRYYQDDRRLPRRTWNGCPYGYTVQDGVCKPYTGR